MSSRRERGGIRRQDMTDTKIDCGFGYDEQDARWDPEAASRAFGFMSRAMERKRTMEVQLAESPGEDMRIVIPDRGGIPTGTMASNYIAYLDREAEKERRRVLFHGGVAAVAAHVESVMEAACPVPQPNASRGQS